MTILVSMCLKTMLIELAEGSTSDLLAAIKSEIPYLALWSACTVNEVGTPAEVYG